MTGGAAGTAGLGCGAAASTGAGVGAGAGGAATGAGAGCVITGPGVEEDAVTGIGGGPEYAAVELSGT